MGNIDQFKQHSTLVHATSALPCSASYIPMLSGVCYPDSYNKNHNKTYINCSYCASVNYFKGENLNCRQCAAPLDLKKMYVQ